MEYTDLYINGVFKSGAENTRFDVINPADESVLASVASAEIADAEEALDAAQDAFADWASRTPRARSEILRKAYELMIERQEEFARLITLENGKAGNDAQGEAAYAAEFFRWFSEEAVRVDGLITHAPASGARIVVQHKPAGIAVLVTPWNYPAAMGTRKIAPALAAGCPVIIKPASETPLTMLALMPLLEEAGVPKGVFNLVNGDGPTVGEAMSAHPKIDMMSFTGSTRAGVAVAKGSADTVKRVHQELGGKSANIILDDADFSKAVSKGTAHMFNNTGQSCNAPSRMLVPAARQDEAKEAAKAVAEGIVVGDPSDESTNMGPVVSDVQFNKIQGLIEKGIEEGAEVVVGGPGKPEGLNQGYFVKPTVFANVSNDMTIAREEIFGPVLCIIPYQDEDDAIKIANDTPYGLSGYVSSEDPERALNVARKIRSGNVHINNKPTGIDAPFGGFKQSGNGREWGEFGFEEFLEIKAVMGYAAK